MAKPPRKPRRTVRRPVKRSGERVELTIAKSIKEIEDRTGHERVQGEPDPISRADQVVLVRIRNILTGARQGKLTNTDLANIKRIATKLGIQI